MFFSDLLETVSKTIIKMLPDREKLLRSLDIGPLPQFVQVFRCKRIGTLTLEGTLGITYEYIFFSGKGLGSFLQKEKIKVGRIYRINKLIVDKNETDIKIRYRKKNSNDSNSIVFRVKESDGAFEALQFITFTMASRSTQIALWRMDLEDWSRLFAEVDYPEEEFPEDFQFFCQGTPLSCMFLLTKGSVSFEKIINGTLTHIATMSAPILIGGESILEFKIPLSAFTVTALEECKAKRVFGKEWQEQQKSNPSAEIAKSIAQESAHMISKLN